MYNYGIIIDTITKEEFGYSSLDEREFIIADIIAIGHSYKDRIVIVEL